MPKYQISGIKAGTDFSYAIRSMNEELKKESSTLEYDNEKGVLTFSTEADINFFNLNLKLAKNRLELKVLEE